MSAQTDGPAPAANFSPAPDSPTFAPTAASEPVAPATSGETVTVACKLPHGLHLDIVHHGEPRQRITLKGGNAPGSVAGFGLTENVPRAFFDAWLDAHQDFPPVRAGLIFAYTKKDSAEARAREYAEARSGLEPLDPKKPGKDLAPLSKE